MKNISLNIDKVAGFVSKETIAAYEPQVKACMETLENGTGKGNDFLGWLHLPSSITAEHLADLKATAQVLRDNCEVVVVAGIGELCKYLNQTGVKKHHQTAQEHQCPYNLSAAHFLFQDKYAGNHHANWRELPNHLRSGRTHVLQG